MTTDEFMVLCDGIVCKSNLHIKPTYEEEKVRIHDRLADTSLEQMPLYMRSSASRNVSVPELPKGSSVLGPLFL